MADGGEMSQPDFAKIPPNQRGMALYRFHTGKEDYGNMDEHFKNCPTCSELLKDIEELKYVNPEPETNEAQSNSISNSGIRGQL